MFIYYYFIITIVNPGESDPDQIGPGSTIIAVRYTVVIQINHYFYNNFIFI